MNNNTNLFKIFCGIAFLAFAAVSCWSTTESLFLTLESAQIPKWVFWIAVVGLFVLTSYCTNLVIKSLNTSNYESNRTLKFFIGLAGFLVLWLLFSMPTNAHTFFYKQMSKQTAINELKYLDNELKTLTDTFDFVNKYNDEWNKYEAKVLAELSQLKQEIDNPQRTGFGSEAEKNLQKIEESLELKVGTITRRGTRNNTQKERNDVCKYYDNEIKNQLEIKQQQHISKVQSTITHFIDNNKNIIPLRNDIKIVLDELNDTSMEREAVLKKARQIIEKCYAELNSSFGNIYTPDESVYRSDRLTKVTKVWGDYFKGRFKDTDYTLWYWILLSIIIDIAAFAFFDLFFNLNDNNL